MSTPPIIQQISSNHKLEIKPFSGDSLEAFKRYGRKEEDKNYYYLQGDEIVGLKLRTNGLEHADFLQDLSLAHLKVLHLGENNLSSLTIPEHMTSLTWLNVEDNQTLKHLSLPDELPELEEVLLSDSGLEALHLPTCSKLKKLDVSRNRLQEFTFSAACPELWWLDLSGNEELKELHIPGEFAKLRFAYFYKSGLQMLATDGSLPELKVLDLEENKLGRWPENFLLPEGMETLYLNGNPIENIPETVRGSGERHNSINDVRPYLLSIIDKEKREYLHQAKMILVGNGEVGKTSIRIRLLDTKAPLPKKKDRTPGLDIVPYELKQLTKELTGLETPIDFQLNIWDFGGQGKYREVQQLFFSPQSLYLFVTACDDTPEEKESYVSFDYWMSLVHALSYDREQEQSSPVIHVVNKIDKERMDIDQTAHNRFGNVEEFHAISCKDLTNFETLRKAIPRVLPKVGQGVFRDKYNEDWLWVMKELQRRQEEHHIAYQEYRDELCKDRLDDEQARAWLRTLDRIGTIIYFGEYEELRDWIILNPNWVKKAVFEVIDSGEQNPIPQWRFEKQIWSHYSHQERVKLLELLQAYNLAYVQQDAYGEHEFVIPALLEKEAPDFKALLPQDVSSLKLRFAFRPFLPAGTVNKLMVRLKDYIYRGLMWKDNVVLHHPDSNAYGHIEEDWQNHFVYLSLCGEDLSAIYTLVSSTVESLNDDFKNTKFLKGLEFAVEGYDGEDWLEGRLLQKFHADLFGFLGGHPQGERKKLQPSPSIVDETKKILFICSSPKGKKLLDFGNDFKHIERARQLADNRDRYTVPEIKTSVETDELLHILTKYQPDILHFSLHSSKSEGLYFENAMGDPEPITPEDFKDIIETYISDPDGKGKIETVILSCCNSVSYGKAITGFADHIVATKDFFPDEAAVLYTRDFYKMLFNDKDIAYAHRTAQTAIKRKKYPTDGYKYPIHEIPVLIKNNPQ